MIIYNKHKKYIKINIKIIILKMEKYFNIIQNLTLYEFL